VSEWFGQHPKNRLDAPHVDASGVPVEDHWGHIDEEWLDAYLSEHEAYQSVAKR
jgi:hypothetical protein